MNSELHSHYNQIHQKGLDSIRTGTYFRDPEINNPLDNRRGITLLLRPDKEACEEIRKFLIPLKAMESGQYYYPPTDFHITIMSVISCYPGFRLEEINPEEYTRIIKNSMNSIGKWTIRLQGSCLTPSGILIKGYDDSEDLNRFRNKLRLNFGQTNLQQSLDSRYAIKTAHSTVMRFQKSLSKTTSIMEYVEENRETAFGKFEAKHMELVYNDWYQKKENTILLKKFSL